MDITLPSILKWKMGRERKTRNQSITVVFGNPIFLSLKKRDRCDWCSLFVEQRLIVSQEKVPGPASPATGSSNKTSCLSPKHHRCSAGFLPPWQRWQTTDHWHFRCQRSGSKIVRISPNQLLSSHSCHTTHCPWTRTYPRLRLGGSDRLEGIANILKWNYITKRYTTRCRVETSSGQMQNIQHLFGKKQTNKLRKKLHKLYYGRQNPGYVLVADFLKWMDPIKIIRPKAGQMWNEKMGDNGCSSRLNSYPGFCWHLLPNRHRLLRKTNFWQNSER